MGRRQWGFERQALLVLCRACFCPSRNVCYACSPTVLGSEKQNHGRSCDICSAPFPGKLCKAPCRLFWIIAPPLSFHNIYKTSASCSARRFRRCKILLDTSLPLKCLKFHLKKTQKRAECEAMPKAKLIFAISLICVLFHLGALSPSPSLVFKNFFQVYWFFLIVPNGRVSSFSSFKAE